MFHRVLTAVCLACFPAFLGGCGGGPTVVKVPSSMQHLKKISAAYIEATKNLGKPPNNLEELKPFLEKLGDLDTILRSPDDGQEYKIFWGVDYNNAKTDKGYLVLAYEQEGKDGKRYVLCVRQVLHLSNEKFQALPFPEGQQAP